MANPADRLAALRALRHALDQQINQQEDEVKQLRANTGARSFDTRFGTVTAAVRKPSLGYTDEQAVAWARQHGYDSLILETPSDTLKRVIREKYVVDDGTVVDTDTGEQVDWPEAKPGGHEYLTVRLSDTTKRQAEHAIQTDRIIAELGEPQ